MSEIKPRLGRGLHAIVVNTLGREIASGTIPSGDVISPELVGTRFGVSKSVVRESLRALESVGFIRAKQKLGTQVLERTHWDLLNPDVIRWRAEGPDYREQMRELFEVRRGIELAAAYFTCMRATPADVARIRTAVDGMEAAYRGGDEEAFVDWDVEFHRWILEASGNPVMAQFSRTVAALLHARHDTRRPTITSQTSTSIANHRALAQAIAGRDSVRAQEVALVIVATPEDASHAHMVVAETASSSAANP